MRLTCPNCAAQYEVPDEVIPQEGRDVQCSNCGNTWFQDHADKLTEAEPEQDAPVEEPSFAPEASEEVEVELHDEEFEDPDPEDIWDTPPSLPVEAETASEAPVEGSQPAQAGLDPAVSEILRQEAEHEAGLRAAETGSGLESQPDLGLDDLSDEAAHRAREAQARMARMRGEDAAVAKEVDPATGADSRRGLLPDIEEINSTLRAADDGDTPPQATDQTEMPPARRGGFTRGFVLSLVVVLVLVLIYANAPIISQSVPAVDPALNTFVGGVDELRAWLDNQVSALLSAE